MNKKTAFDFDALLERSAKTHGHLCPGPILGVKMSMFGLSEIGITDPKGTDMGNIIVFGDGSVCD